MRGAADGSGPAAGARVVLFADRAFAERVALDASAVAEVTAGVGLAEAGGPADGGPGRTPLTAERGSGTR